MGIIHDQAKNTQSFLGPTRGECISIAVHPNRKIVAISEMEPRPYIYIYDTSSDNKQIALCKQGLEGGVDNLAFSPDGSMLLASTLTEKRSIMIFEQPSYDMIVSDTIGERAVTAICFINNSKFVAVGDEIYNYYFIDDEGLGNSHVNFLETDPKGTNTFTCAARCPNEDIVVGNAIGQLQVWKQNERLKIISAHKGVLDALTVTSSA